MMQQQAIQETASTHVKDVTEDAWGTFVGLEVTLAPTAGALSPGPRLVATVQIEGAWSGIVALECPSSLGRRAAALMFQIDDASVPDADVADVVGEIVNVIGGGLKSVLPEPSSMSTPTVSWFDDGWPEPPCARVVAYSAFHCGPSLFGVTVLECDDASTEE